MSKETPKRYQLASAGAFIFPSGKRVECPDGCITPETPEEAEYLALSAEAGCVTLLTEEVAASIAAKISVSVSDHK